MKKVRLSFLLGFLVFTITEIFAQDYGTIQVDFLRLGLTSATEDQMWLYNHSAQGPATQLGIFVYNHGNNPGYGPNGCLTFQSYQRDLTIKSHDGKNLILNPNDGSGVNVGIGTNNPEYKLDIDGPTDYFQLRVKAPNSPRIKLAGAYNGGNGAELLQNPEGDIRLNINSSTTGLLIKNQGSGWIGIGNVTPAATLHIGTNQDITQNPNSTGLLLNAVQANGGSGQKWLLSNGVANVDNADFGIRDVTSGVYRMVIDNANGNVGIGTDSPDPLYKLTVDGSIKSKKVKVTQTGWSDFVFNDDYKLMSISDLEKYIQKHKHLPDVPSETEVLDEGVDLGEMNAKLLQKIEELTLYIIKLNEEVEKLKNK